MNNTNLLLINSFNPASSSWMHIDLNSCFATIEQQANPLLRGKPIAVAAYTTPRGCILAPSIEAKRFGVQTGMRVMDGKKLCPHLLILPSDPAKYRFINQKMERLFSNYTPYLSVRSIDEVLLHFVNLPILAQKSLRQIGREIKTRIKAEIGDWLTVSVGISTNPYLAKLAANIRKPDGLDEINAQNILAVLSRFQLTDLPYIKERNALRLSRVGVHTALDFYMAAAGKLTSAFESIQGDYWWRRLHGYSVDEVEWERKTIGHSYALPKFTSDINLLEKLLCKLVVKMGSRLRRNQFTARGIHLSCEFSDWSFFHHGHTFPNPLYTDSELFAGAKYVLATCPAIKPVRNLAVSCFSLTNDLYNQLTFFSDEQKKRRLTAAVDTVNGRWGDFSVVPARMIDMDNTILDRISFGGVRDITRVI